MLFHFLSHLLTTYHITGILAYRECGILAYHWTEKQFSLLFLQRLFLIYSSEIQPITVPLADIPIFTELPRNATGDVTSGAHFRCAASAHAQPTLRWYRSYKRGTLGQEVTSQVLDGRGEVRLGALVFEVGLI